jgi:epsilon-lactone hydrolase
MSIARITSDGSGARRPSLRMRLARAAVRLWGRLTRGTAFRRDFIGRTYPSPARITWALLRRCEIQEEQVLGQVVYTLTPKRPAPGPGTPESGEPAWHIVYTHGGGFVHPLQKAHWYIIAALVDATGATVTVPVYPLAPEHQYQKTFCELEQVYRGLLERVTPDRIILCGDSAGGNLALSQALYYRERGLPLPGHLILLSPWLDVTMSNPEAKAVESRDLVLRVATLQQWGRWWAGSADPRTPILSPIFGDLRGLPPIQIYIGSDDVLLPDARKLRGLVAAAGGRIQLAETPAGFHAFMGAAFTPEAKRVFRQIAENLGLAPAGAGQ